MAEIDLSLLPPPDVVEALDYEAIVAAMLADLRARDPDYSAIVESDPAFKILEVCAYREFLLRARVNDAARAVMLAYAAGPDLDQIAALLGAARAEGESDVRLRARAQLAPESYTVAGPEAAYRFRTLEADPRVLDVGVDSPAPGEIRIVALGGDHPDGAAGAALVAVVDAALSARDVRPLTDDVTVLGAEILPYEIEAALAVEDGPDAGVVRAAAEEAVLARALAAHRVGATVHRSALFASLHVPGVVSVALAAPAADVVATALQAPWCTSGASAPYSAPATHPLDGVTVTI